MQEKEGDNTMFLSYSARKKMVMMVAMKQIHHLVSTMCEEEKMVKEMLNNGGLDSTRSIKVKGKLDCISDSGNRRTAAALI